MPTCQAHYRQLRLRRQITVALNRGLPPISPLDPAGIAEETGDNPKKAVQHTGHRKEQRATRGAPADFRN